MTHSSNGRSSESIVLEQEYLLMLIEDISTINEKILETAQMIGAGNQYLSLRELKIIQAGLQNMIELIKGRVKVLAVEQEQNG